MKMSARIACRPALVSTNSALMRAVVVHGDAGAERVEEDVDLVAASRSSAAIL